ncbi:MAG: hypothetical protein CME05_10425 [Gemmatimonadaceae bacterium]|nr:hypothetical protein [Gemmatimonadaceae bacterium]
METLVGCVNLLQQSNSIDEEQDRGRADADRDPQTQRTDRHRKGGFQQGVPANNTRTGTLMIRCNHIPAYAY